MVFRRCFGVRALLLLAAALLLPGCSLLATGAYIIDPRDVAAEYRGLKDKRVAVVCRAGASSAMEAASATHEISQQVAGLLKQNVRHIHLVPQQEVNDWLDNNEMKSFHELGKAVHADKVVAIELTHVSLYEGKTLFRGRAKGSITVIDVADGDKTPLRPLDVAYPPRDGVPTGISEDQFRAKFLGVLCGKIARRFYSYDSKGEVMKEEDYYQE